MFNSFFPASRAVYEIMRKNMVQPDRLQVAIQNGAWALHAA